MGLKVIMFLDFERETKQEIWMAHTGYGIISLYYNYAFCIIWIKFGYSRLPCFEYELYLEILSNIYFDKANFQIIKRENDMSGWLIYFRLVYWI